MQEAFPAFLGVLCSLWLQLRSEDFLCYPCICSQDFYIPLFQPLMLPHPVHRSSAVSACLAKPDPWCVYLFSIWRSYLCSEVAAPQGVPGLLRSSAFLYCLLCDHIYHTLALSDEPAFPEAAGYICLGVHYAVKTCTCASVVTNRYVWYNCNFAALSTPLTWWNFVASVGESISVG